MKFYTFGEIKKLFGTKVFLIRYLNANDSYTELTIIRNDRLFDSWYIESIQYNHEAMKFVFTLFPIYEAVQDQA